MTGPVPARTAAVVVNWNGRADTGRCVRSLLAPGGPDRVVVVDNGSRGGEQDLRPGSRFVFPAPTGRPTAQRLRRWHQIA